MVIIVIILRLHFRVKILLTTIIEIGRGQFRHYIESPNLKKVMSILIKKIIFLRWDETLKILN